MSGSEPKSRGGRPPAFPPETMKMVRATFPEVTTRRGQLDVAYRLEALRLATPEERESLRVGGGFPLPPTVLTELGRFIRDGWPTGNVRQLWDLVAYTNPTARDACRVLQTLRLWEGPFGRAIEQFFTDLGAVGRRANLSGEWWAAVLEEEG